MAVTRAKVTHLVVDSGALIKNAPVQDIGTIVYSVPGIVDEIRDRPTRHRLQVLPFEMKLREPSTEAIKFITDFSKKTGDYPSLSAIDIKVLALTYEIEKEQIGTEHLNTEPKVNRTVKVGRSTAAGDLGTIAGFYMPKKKEGHLASHGNVIKSNSDKFENENELEALDDFLSDVSYVEGYQPSQADSNLFNIITHTPSECYPHLLRWYIHILSYGEERKAFFGEEKDLAVFKATILNNFKNKQVALEDDQEDTSKELENNLEHLSLDGKEGSDTNKEPQNNLEHQPLDDKEGSESIQKVEILVKDVNEGNSDECNEADDGEGLEGHEDEWIVSENTDEWNSDDEDDEFEDDDDDEGWITSANIDEAKKERGLVSIDEDSAMEVACLTTDFSMQNVLKQIGLQVVSVNGMLIKHTKTFVLRCYSCFKTTSIMTKIFCPKCGNRTLKRVTMTLNEDGSQEIHLSSRVRLTGKGKRFSLPMPKGGMHAQNPIVCEDQRGSRCLPTKKARDKTNVMDEDYITGASPFATHDLYSRSAMLGFRNKGQQVRHWARRDLAIETKKNTKKKKK